MSAKRFSVLSDDQSTLSSRLAIGSTACRAPAALSGAERRIQPCEAERRLCVYEAIKTFFFRYLLPLGLPSVLMTELCLVSR